MNDQADWTSALPAPVAPSLGTGIRIGREGSLRPIAVGGGAPIKLVAPFGVSGPEDDPRELPAAISSAVAAGADAVQELSTFGEFWRQRPELIAASAVPYGTVLTYELFDRLSHYKTCTQTAANSEALAVLHQQIEQGIDYVTLHSSLDRALLRSTANGRLRRVIPVPSRAGAMLMRLCDRLGIDNPLADAFSSLARACAASDVVISLGGSLRPASIADALDEVQRIELERQGQITAVAHALGAAVMIEGLSHAVPADLREYVALASRYCGGAPITALGPLPTDIAAGCDHIAASTGVMFGSLYGLSLVNVVTAKEHLAMPTSTDMVDALRAARIGAYLAEVLRTGSQNRRDAEMSAARRELDWRQQEKLALFGDLVHQLVAEKALSEGKPCSICLSKCPFLAARALKSAVW